jgi:hypothetical protein
MGGQGPFAATHWCDGVTPKTDPALGSNAGSELDPKWWRETQRSTLDFRQLRADCAVASIVCAPYGGWWQPCRELGSPGYDPLASTGANVNRLIPNTLIDPISARQGRSGRACATFKKRYNPAK